MGPFFLEAGKSVPLGPKLGGGGEAEVFAVANDSSLVAKLYHAGSSDRIAKLRVMVGNPPEDPAIAQGHISICWPMRLLFDHLGSPVGFLMRRIDYATSIPLFKIYNPLDRRRSAVGFTWRYLVQAAANIARVVEALHARGYVIGDLNESNILVANTALVSFVDCDSMQVPNAATGKVFRCPVGKPEFTPPELQGRDFSTIDRHIEHDNFGLATLVFLLLYEGVHPFAGVWRGSGDPPPLEQRIQRSYSPYFGASVSPMPVALPFDVTPPDVRDLFARCFVQGRSEPRLRPGAREWHVVLQQLERSLRTCTLNSRHLFSDHLSNCPWCTKTKRLGGFDYFPEKITTGSYGTAAPTPAKPTTVPAQGPLPTPAQPYAPPNPVPPKTAPGPIAAGVSLKKETWSRALNYAFFGVFFYWIWHPMLTSIFEAFAFGRQDANVLSIGTFITVCILLGYWSAKQLSARSRMPILNPATARPTTTTVNPPYRTQTWRSTQPAAPTSYSSSAVVVASRIRRKYHSPSCKWARKISGRNRIPFTSASDAVAAGYQRCRTCLP